MIQKITWEFDGRCPKCGSENLYGDEDFGFECVECEHEFIVEIDISDAIFY